MAFTGVAVFENVSDRVVRITGLSLGIAAAGVIGLFGSGLEVELPENFQPSDYGSVDLIESVKISHILVTAEAVAPAVQVVKTLPVGVFTATLTNGGAAATGGLEIYVEFH